MKRASPLAPPEIRFRSMFEQTPELMLYQDENSIILDANPAFLALVGQPIEQVLNRQYDDFLPVEVRPMFRAKLAEAFAGHLVRFTMYTAQEGAGPRYWDVVKVPLLVFGRVIGVHMVARDITETVQQQEQIFEQYRELQQFTNIVSHNLRAPLANALGLVRLLRPELKDTVAFETVRAHLQHSLEQLDGVLHELNELLTPTTPS